MRKKMGKLLDEADGKVRKAVSMAVIAQVSQNVGVFRPIIRAKMQIAEEIQRSIESSERPN
jgi:hypothetical protein